MLSRHALPKVSLNQLYTIAWLNFGSLAIATTLASLFLFHVAIKTNFRTAQNRLHMLCMEMDTAAAEVIATPQVFFHYVMESNQIAVDNIRHELLIAITLMENSILWAIGVYKSSIQCFLGLAINGLLEVITKITTPVQQATETIWQSTDAIETQLKDWLSNSNSSSTGTYSNLTAATVAFGNWTNTLSEIEIKVANWTASNETNLWIDKPFQGLKYQVNSSFINISKTIQPAWNSADIKNVFVCDSTDITAMLQQTEAELLRLTYILMGVLLIAFLVCAILNAMHLRLRHRLLERATPLLFSTSAEEENQRLTYNRQTDNAHYLSRLVTQPFVSRLASINSAAIKKQRSSRWWLIAFLTQPMILYCLGLALCGMTTVGILTESTRQLFQNRLGDFERNMQRWANATLETFLMNTTIQVQSQTDQLNQWISETEIQLNNETLAIARGTASMLNATLTAVVDTVQIMIHDTLDDTILQTPAKSLLQCLFLSKIAPIEEGLTWVVNHSYLNLSRMDAMDIRNWSGSSLEHVMQTSLDGLWEDVQMNLSHHLEAHLRVYCIPFSVWLVCLVIALIFVVSSLWANKQRKKSSTSSNTIHAFTSSISVEMK
ncbi:plasma membrane fusion protein prm1 [Apophysomyces ossiformis]|uniref:Plasma membrane fusion protein PRM1 n=1 Tax=Apophysomyces ossiformis TaxID=679940 RepID=A0A8H7BMJ6_9FUNG|nr:plasma membrane fusion protein prm1 [Apophysomyces ossiformis]